MCVTWAFLWNTHWLAPSGCGHARPPSPRTLALRAVDRPWTAVDEEAAKILPEACAQDWLPVFSLMFFSSSWIRNTTMNNSSTTR